MKNLLIISLFSVIAACGNPHVSSVRNNIDQIVSPLSEEECADALSDVRVHTEQEQYQSVAECQEQQQQQQQAQQPSKNEWMFEMPVEKFGTVIPETNDKAIVRALDCNGSLIIEEEILPGTHYVGFTGSELELCSFSVDPK